MPTAPVQETPHRITMPPATMQVVLLELRDAAQLCVDHKTPHAVSSLATVVATLILHAGRRGSGEQQRMMDLAHNCGFAPEFYGSGVRCTFKARGKATR